MSQPAASTRPEDKVPMQTKLAYGAAGMVDGWGNYVPKSMANQVFNMTLGMSPAYISIAFLVFRLWDACTDPIMGWLSDRTRTRWGRRRPFILLGGVLTALLFPLIWFVPAGWSEPSMVAWLIGTGVLFYTAFTIWAMPYQSLLLEMTPDTHERTRVTAIRAYISKIGALGMGWIWAITQLPFFTDPATGKADTLLGMRTVSIVLAVLILVLATLPFFFVKERYYAQAVKSGRKESLIASLGQTFRNRPFVLLIGATITFSIGSNMTNGFGVYVNTYYVQGGDKAAASIMTGWVNTVSLITGMASIPLFTWLTRRVGKHVTLMIAMGVLAFSSLITWWTYNPAYPWLVLVNAVLNSPGMTGMWLVIPSMTADVVDQDELQTGERREGGYAAVYSWVIKASIAIGYGLSGPLLEITGFDAKLGAAQLPEALHSMRLWNAFIPAASMAAAFFFIVRYPLTSARMDEIRATLESRRGNV